MTFKFGRRTYSEYKNLVAEKMDREFEREMKENG
jgi:hypothetical protein